MTKKNFIQFNDETADAISSNKPIVALESTIISHGMPYPRNVETAKEVEGIIRKAGAVPATIAIMGSKICVGLNDAELEILGKSSGAMKVSRRDLPYALSQGIVGATTVAATMICSEMAGIEVFVTGGIGGVHQGAEETFDISADLTELSKTNVTVVCAGAKSILDIPKTLEYLETMGVPVITRNSENFAAFFVADSGYRGNFRMDEARDIAKFILAKRNLDLTGGVLISNPIPTKDEYPSAEINQIISAAQLKGEKLGIKGKDVTPFLLKEINTRSGGKSLEANIALVKNNAQFGAEIAKALLK